MKESSTCFTIKLAAYYDSDYKINIEEYHESALPILENIMNSDKSADFSIKVINTKNDEEIPDFGFILHYLLRDFRFKDAFLYKDVFLKLAEKDNISDDQLPLYQCEFIFSLLRKAFCDRIRFSSTGDGTETYMASSDVYILFGTPADGENYYFKFIAPEETISKEVQRIYELPPEVIVNYILPNFYWNIIHDVKGANGFCKNPDSIVVRDIGDYYVRKD